MPQIRQVILLLIFAGSAVALETWLAPPVPRLFGIGQVSPEGETMFAANPRLPWPELYRRGMNIGLDHIASMVNTLLLAYVGASLPLLLLLWGAGESFLLTLNGEFIAEEIVRTLVGSLGLLSAVPITTLLASWAAQLARRLGPTGWAIVGPLGDAE